MWSGIDEHAKSDDKLVSQLYLNFFACGKKSIEVTNLFNHFKWMCSDAPKVIQNHMLDFLHIGRLQQKQLIAVGFPKF